jgi:2-iminobutanoate/2-iminopropanoate deaminase
MEITAITCDKSPQALGPYSQAISHNNLIFSSGQLGINPQTNKLQEGIEQQTKQLLQNLSELLKESNSSLENILKTTIYLKNLDDFNTVNEIYASYVKDPYPSRSTAQVAKLPLDALIEIDVIATHS